MEIIGIIFWIIILFIGVLLYKAKKERNQQLEQLTQYEEFIRKNGMNNCQSVSFKNITRIDIDTKNKLLGAYSYYEDECIVLKFEEILDFEIFENGNSVVSSRTGNVIAGGLLFGGLGAVAGASGSRTINEVCRNLKLIIYTTDISNSVAVLNFLEHSIYKTNPLYQEISGVIDNMISFLKIAREHNRQMERHEDKKVIVENANDIKEDSSINKIKELAELKEKGIITESEFEEGKKKILSKL